MSTLRKRGDPSPGSGAEFLMREALAEFEADSRLACRALRVCMAVKVFGVGTVLPNELPEELPAASIHQSSISHTLQ